jgi:hypothetical protein
MFGPVLRAGFSTSFSPERQFASFILKNPKKHLTEAGWGIYSFSSDFKQPWRGFHGASLIRNMRGNFVAKMHLYIFCVLGKQSFSSGAKR